MYCERFVARVSLQATKIKQVIHKNYCLLGMYKHQRNFLYVSSDDIQSNEGKFILEEHYALFKTIIGTRLHHGHVPSSEVPSQQTKGLSGDRYNFILTEVSFKIHLVSDNAVYQLGQYFTSTYENERQINHIVEHFDCNNYVKLNVMR